jgi:hypothetical protein
MATIPRFLGIAVASFALAVFAATLTGCGGPRHGGATRPGGATLPAPDLCTTMDRELIDTAIAGKVDDCESTTKQPHEHRVRFTGTSSKDRNATEGRGGKGAGESLRRKAAGSGRREVSVAYRLRMDPRTGVDRWATLGRVEGQRVEMLSVGEEAVFDYAAESGPDLAVLKDALIVLITHSAPEPDEQLPDHLSAIAADAIKQARAKTSPGPPPRPLRESAPAPESKPG